MNIFRLIHMMFKANIEAGRRLSIDEFIAHQTKKVEIADRAMFNRAIGSLCVAWGFVEVLLDYSNLTLITSFDIDETQLPVSLKPKLAFFRKHFLSIPSLKTYRDRAVAIVDRANELKEVRHDVIHGFADKKTPLGIRRFMRLDYRGKTLVHKPKDFTLEQIVDKTEEITDLAASIKALLTEVIEIELRKGAKDATR